MKILLIGAYGLLGSEIRKLNHDVITPTSDELDIHFPGDIQDGMDRYSPDIIINAAAIKDNRSIEQDPRCAIHTNIIGAAYLSELCFANNIRYVYISTDYVYRGDRGNYLETDEVYPANAYAWTKLGGECSARMVKNHLIIRTSFGADKFDYPVAFSDKWSSKDYVDVIAPMILEAAISPITGVLNIGTDRKTIYEHAHDRNSDVAPVRLADTSHNTPYDTSLNLQKWLDYKSINPTARPHSSCRACGSDKLVKYLDLGLMPLANNLETTSARAREKERFPLQVMCCQDCGLSQLSVVIDPEKMFSYYTYRSGVNRGYKIHCLDMIKELYPFITGKESIFHIDIAGNDGTLLLEFKQVLSEFDIEYYPLNIDPATNLAAVSEAAGIPTIADFFNNKIANRIKQEYGCADLITATNVFAHVDDIEEFLFDAKFLLKPDGILIIECPYILDFIANVEFDTVYFEHLSYMSVSPVDLLCGKLGLKIIDVQKHAIHGGTIRIIIARETSDHKIQPAVKDMITLEKDSKFSKDREKYSGEVQASIENFGARVLELKRAGYRIGAFAASAKGNTLLNSARINTDIVEYICDETPEKIGKYSPGTGIPIVNKYELAKNPVDYLLILSWNFKDDIMAKAREAGFTGKFIVPIPKFEIVE